MLGLILLLVFKFCSSMIDENRNCCSWGSWTPCTKTCVGATKTRYTDCDALRVGNEDSSCLISTSETVSCFITIPCKVNGTWGSWVSWTQCTKTCAGGTRTRYRPCNNPTPANGGFPCPGSRYETVSCSTNVSCRVNGNWGSWVCWSQCTKTCAGGTRTRHRSCNNPTPVNGGSPCLGLGNETVSCSTTISCTVNGGWGTWVSWTHCTKTCAGGTRTRYRPCNKPTPANGGLPCPGSRYETVSCSTTVLCPVNGDWGSWVCWTQCTKTCAGGTRTRHRSCNNPTPVNGGSPCPGLGNETVSCSTTISCTDQPTTSPTITQTPVGPIIEGNNVTLTCTVQGGNPVATITWSCDGATQITPTGSPSTEDAISSVELLTSKNNNGQICTCTGRHPLWTDDKIQQHTITVYYEPTSSPSILQTPSGPINERSTVILTCDIKGGNPIATITWTCEGSSLIDPTGSPPTNTAISSVQLTVNSNNNGKICTCVGHHTVWTIDKTTSHTLDVRYQPTTSPTITQTPVGTIIEGNNVTLTCTVQGGHPVATITWSCDGATQITPTGSPSTEDVISSVELLTSKNNNGQICTCTGKHLLWTDDKIQQHIITVYLQRYTNPTPISQDSNGLFAGGISSLIIGLISIIFSVSFVFLCRSRLRKREQMRTNDYTEFAACTHCNPVVKDSYDSINTTAIEPADVNETQTDRNINTYEECLPVTNVDHTCNSLHKQPKEKKKLKKNEEIYENMKI